MASTWVFSCKLGLEQNTCDEYERDESARLGKWDGCPSCVHRIPDSFATEQAEWEYENV
jgi:hypothetical protein